MGFVVKSPANDGCSHMPHSRIIIAQQTDEHVVQDSVLELQSLNRRIQSRTSMKNLAFYLFISLRKKDLLISFRFRFSVIEVIIKENVLKTGQSSWFENVLPLVRVGN